MEYNPVISQEFVHLVVEEAHKTNERNALKPSDFIPFFGMFKYLQRVAHNSNFNPTSAEIQETRAREPTRLESVLALGTDNWPRNPELQDEQMVCLRRHTGLFLYHTIFALVPVGAAAYSSNIAELVQKIV